MPNRPSELRALKGHPHAPLFDAMLNAALAAVEPADAVRRHLGWLTPAALRLGEVVQTLEPGAKVHVIAAGKAAGRMLEGCLAELGGPEDPRLGQLVTVAPVAIEPCNDRHASYVGGHPLPTQGSVDAGIAALKLADDAADGDIVLVLVSGGASAMLCAPLPEVGLEGLRAATQVLLDRPVEIQTINQARACLDAVKFGGLLRAAGQARCAALVLSDVPGDELDIVGGGPTRHRPLDAAALAALREILQAGGAWEALPTPAREAIVGYTAPPPPPKRRPFDQLVASNVDARLAACGAAEALGVRGVDLGGGLRGETHDALAELLAESQRAELDAFAARPRVLVVGGETIVHRTGSGRGGRNLHLALLAVPALDAQADTVLMTLATDGADGNSGSAGAVVCATSLDRARERGLEHSAFAAGHDAASFFDALGDTLCLGPTGTNVCDLAFLLQTSANP